MTATTKRISLIGLCLALAFGASVQAQERHRPDPNKFAFRFLGPEHGNRIASVAGVPGDPNTYYLGASSGGIWKSIDGGNNWTPIFDDEPVAAIGALAVAPSNPNVVWAGTGEAWAIRDIDIGGDGVYLSTDAGKTWRHVGLDQAGRIGRIVVDPRDPLKAYVCAVGRMTGPQQERGVFYTADGGKTWTRSLFVDEHTGCSGLAMDPHDPNTLFAGTWQVEMRTWGEFSGGPGSGVYVTHDGGRTWRHIEGHGLPHSPLGKIDVAVAPTDSKRVYALIETDGQGSFWRSDDGGEDWRVTSWDRTLIGRAGYYIRIAVSPADENNILVSNSSFHVSKDGGYNFPIVHWGGDNHDIWIDPKNPDRFVITYDGGAAITTSGGKGFDNVALPIGQMYHVAVDDQIPYYVYGNMQDNSTMRGPSLPRMGGSFGIGAGAGWDYKMGGCESGFTLPEISNPNIVWASCYGDEVTRWDARTQHARSVSPWFHTLDSAPNETKYRCHWTVPLALDPFDPKTVYYGCQVVFETKDEGQSWRVISPDLSRRDPSRIVSSGGIIPDNLGQFYGEVIFALAPSQIRRGLLWAGTNDGKVWYTPDGGRRWNDVTKNIPDLPPWGTITSIEPSAHDPNTAYISVDLHLVDNYDPYVYKTTDMGRTWTNITSNLPKGPLAYVRNISEDPNTKGLLFVGTGNALYYSLDDGAHWVRFKDGLPPSPVTWTVVQKRFHDLVVSTWGRGWYILDDITPLEEMAKRPPSTTEATFFKPRLTYRLPGEKAFINFYVPSASKTPATIQILDANGAEVRTLKPKVQPGLNRVAWDLRYNNIKTITLLTIPPEDPHIWQEPRFKGKNARPVTHWGMAPRQAGPVVAPGDYQVRLTVGGRTYVQPLTVVLDPNGGGTVQDARATLALQLRIAADVTKISDMVNPIEVMRNQLQTLESKLEVGKSDPGLLAAVTRMDERMQQVEYSLFSRYLAPSDDKYYEHAYKIYYNLLWLNGEVGTGAGDVAGSGDYGPTDTAPMLLNMLEKELAAEQPDYRMLMDRDVPGFDRVLVAHGLPALVKTAPEPEEQANSEDEDDASAED